MQINSVHCGILKVQATKMIKPLESVEIAAKYEIDQDGYMRLSMQTVLVEESDRKVLIDPGTADFLPLRLRQEYGVEMPVPLEEELEHMGVTPDQITDVVFTHLHFDHASGAFKRVPGNIVKRFPKARYHLLKEHYQYALDPDPFEAESFCTGLFKYVDRIHWLEDWDIEWMSFKVFNGHTRGMVLPEIHANEGLTYFMSDLVPMEIFLKPELWCGYDLEPGLVLREKEKFLQDLTPLTRLLLFHDTLKESVFYE
jgi:glyoxylase-like metal-dependent hydrolase (beta-lactamase superfamily II)